MGVVMDSPWQEDFSAARCWGACCSKQTRDAILGYCFNRVVVSMGAGWFLDFVTDRREQLQE
jgi:hypothetical protein